MGNKVSSKFKRKSRSENKKRASITTKSSRLSSVNPATWSWNINGVWRDFEQITSKEIDDSIHTEWSTTSDNPLQFPLTSGTWFSRASNHNIYSVEVHLNDVRDKITKVYQINKNTNFRRKLKRTPLYILGSHNNSLKDYDIYNDLLMMGFDKSASHQASINCTTLNSAIEYISSSSSQQKRKTAQSMKNEYFFDKPMDIARFEFVDKRSQYLIFGYIRMLQGKYLKACNIPIEINQICAVFYFDEYQLQIKMGKQIDGRDRWGKWYIAEIKYHKKADDPFPEKVKLHKKQIVEKNRLEKLEGVFLHFLAWEEKWDEWIFIEPNTICTCNGECMADKSDHRLSAPNTQSMVSRKKKHKNPASMREVYDTINGEPLAPGCVGLVNMGNTTYMNAVIQCIANTPELLPYFTTRKYELDLNTSNNQLGMKGKFARAIGTLLIDIWSNNFKVIRPDLLRQYVVLYGPQFVGSKFVDVMKFLYFVLSSLNDELNLIKVKPYTEKVDCDGKSDEIIAELSWKQHLQKNNSKIVHLFHGLVKSYVTCGECKTESINFKPYTYLSVPVKDKANKSFIVDVFHRKVAADPLLPSKPIRHVFHVKTNEKIQDLAKIIGKEYNVKYQFVLFYENWNMRARQEWYHDQLLGTVPNNEALACYILKDYNEEVTTKEIKTKKLSLLLASVCHSMPLNGNRFDFESLFGMPFVISFLNTHTRRDVNKAIYERLHLWLGSDVLMKPPTLIKLNDVLMNGMEWDAILNYLPFTLRLLTNRGNSRYLVPVIPCDDAIFGNSAPLMPKDFNKQILIEWKQEFYDKIKSIVNKVVVDMEYSKWKKKRKANSNCDALTLYDCMDDYVSGTIAKKNDAYELIMYCSNCKKPEKLTKRIDIWSFPEILIIHLNRYPNSWPNCNVGRNNSKSIESDKIQTNVDCPINGLDLTKYETNNSVNIKPVYDLYATINVWRGHYASSVKNNENDKWYWFNDSEVECVEQPKINDTTYILFYKKRSAI